VDRELTFPRGWHATDLGEYRSCEFTYETYAHESLPLLDPARLTGHFDWLGPPARPDDDGLATMARLSADVAALALALPADFATFHSTSNYRYVLDEVSVTGSWSDIAGPAPSPVEPGAALVRVFSDQQYCACWYLYLRPSGEAFVVCDRDPYPAEPKFVDLDETFLSGDFLWCANSFEEFAYRYWIENQLWRSLHKYPDVNLSSDMIEYLNHYRA